MCKLSCHYTMADWKWGIFQRAEPLHAATLCDLSDSNRNLSPYEGRAASLNLEGFVIIPNPLYLMNPPAREIWEISDSGQPWHHHHRKLVVSCRVVFHHMFFSVILLACICPVGGCMFLYPGCKNILGCRWFHCGCGSARLLFPESESGAIWPGYGPHAPETSSHC